MQYRKLPHGGEQISVIGLGMGGIQCCSDDEIERIVRRAIQNGINYFDMCGGAERIYAPFGRAIAKKRDEVMLQLHFGAVYNAKGEYAWSRNADEIKQTVARELETIGTDYIDMGFLHCVDDEKDFDELISSGLIDYIIGLKDKGVVRHIGFSSHTPALANKILDFADIDMMMFSINPAYDFELGDEYGIGTNTERSRLFRRCEKEGVGISVMKPFHGGKLLDAASSPFSTPLSVYQCIQYSLDRPGVMCVLPGVQSEADLEVLLGFESAPERDKDYSVIGSLTPDAHGAGCVYCNHCQPCPAGIDIALVNKYYDLSLAGDRLAVSHYSKLSVTAESCISCGHCDARCPFSVLQGERMEEIRRYFGK